MISLHASLGHEHLNASNGADAVLVECYGVRKAHGEEESAEARAGMEPRGQRSIRGKVEQKRSRKARPQYKVVEG